MQQFQEKGPQVMISVVFLHNSDLFSRILATNQDDLDTKGMDAVPTRYSAIHLCFHDALILYVCKSAIIISMVPYWFYHGMSLLQFEIIRYSVHRLPIV